MGVGRLIPNAGVLCDIGWDPVLAKQWKTVINQWTRMQAMSDDRYDRKLFIWSTQILCRNRKKLEFSARNILTETSFDVLREDSHSGNIVNTGV